MSLHLTKTNSGRLIFKKKGCSVTVPFYWTARIQKIVTTRRA